MIRPARTWKSRRSVRAGTISRSVTEMSVWQSSLVITSKSSPRRDRIELARDVVEQEDRRVAEARAHLGQLSQLERQHERPELALRGVGAGQRAREANLEVVGLGSKAGEAAPLVERPPLGQPPRERRADAVLVGGRLDRGIAPVDERDRQIAVQRAKMVGQARRQRGDQRPTAHHDARARARQLVVEGVEQGPVPVPPLEQRVPVAEDLLERAGLARSSRARR